MSNGGSAARARARVVALVVAQDLVVGALGAGVIVRSRAVVAIRVTREAAVSHIGELVIGVLAILAPKHPLDCVLKVCNGRLDTVHVVRNLVVELHFQLVQLGLQRGNIICLKLIQLGLECSDSV